MTRPILFIGDSVTDCDRDRLSISSLGDGYVRNIEQRNHFSSQIINRGISGDRIGNLESRWKSDVLDFKPSILSVLIGVNDTWRRFDDNDPTSAEIFIEKYRKLLELTKSQFDFTLLLCQPFILPVREEMNEWLEDLDEKSQAIKSLAKDLGATFVPFGEYLSTQANELGMTAIAEDGIHPTVLGHELMADFWLKHI